ncbi:3-hydroxyacyl-CoA dehydrogenase NAD-binding domain-containing protein [Edaphobacter dinghuensis]|uniref:3-hydroxyacyl-CoA dehydrogenase NAD-binding domain-containing protein n=1 Tax=Edaphobacter dinghuensis TaxID=1560005 RepID=UPI0016661B80|nr:3-hydroxyacyl-CoA dehydrogenase NAD-binding domain-containing protein [Edaphobacter dinghuensis]
MQPVGSPSPFEIRTVAVIGAGTAGRSFALACVAAGFHVVLEDVMPANLRRAEADFAEMDLRESQGRLDLALTVEDAVREADIAVDFVPDELESKLEIFSMIDRMAPPKTILCTPSDALSITDLASCVYRPERCFAVRGDLMGGDAGVGPMVRLLYPISADSRALTAMGGFLRSLGRNVQNEPDPDVPVLMKNQISTAL